MVSQHDDGWSFVASSREQKRPRRTQVIHTARNAWAYGRGMVRRTHRHSFDGILELSYCTGEQALGLFLPYSFATGFPCIFLIVQIKQSYTFVPSGDEFKKTAAAATTTIINSLRRRFVFLMPGDISVPGYSRSWGNSARSTIDCRPIQTSQPAFLGQDTSYAWRPACG